ncbi:flagellar biosynthesis anti-sigma factor FlgM [Rosenbergiella nectarea]|uniref:flagellar biosynthesis anti-sigma factor FlgM n=1 Tax=Rosenbergiella nectarea TaxID=988801 RepID=UPI001F4E82E5|nr:flagellar biosynthesis anti-sigma factor FlgM [Rosenbergiella nectarea]
MIKLTPTLPNDRVSTSMTQSVKTENREKVVSTKIASPSTEQTLTQAREQLGQLPEVDLDKVAEVKAALSRGEIGLDSDALAQSMLAFFQRSE